MNLAPVRIEHAHGDGVRRPVNVDHKRNRASGAMSVGDQFANHGRRRVEKLDSALHDRGMLREAWERFAVTLGPVIFYRARVVPQFENLDS
jgi:hypothetical protein